MHWWQEAQSFIALASQEKIAVFFPLKTKEKQAVAPFGLILESLSQGIYFSGDLEYLVPPRSVAFVHWTVLQSNFQFFKFCTCGVQAFIHIHLLAGRAMGRCYTDNSPLDNSTWSCRDNSMCVSNRRWRGDHPWACSCCACSIHHIRGRRKRCIGGRGELWWSWGRSIRGNSREHSL